MQVRSPTSQEVETNPEIADRPLWLLNHGHMGYVNSVSVSTSTISDDCLRNIPFSFDDCFGPECATMGVYCGSVAPVLQRVLNGTCCGVMVYGATGTGKTTLMSGRTGSIVGLGEICCRELLSAIGGDLSGSDHVPPCVHPVSVSPGTPLALFVSYCQIAREEINDILRPGDQSTNLRIRQLPCGHNHVPDLAEIQVRSFAEAIALLRTPHPTYRTTFAVVNPHKFNPTSVLQLIVRHRGHCQGISSGSDSGVGDVCSPFGRLSLVDMPGTERRPQRPSGGVSLGTFHRPDGMTLLLSLRSVIDALLIRLKETRNLAGCTQQISTPRVPYRDSKFTRLLQAELSFSPVSRLGAHGHGGTSSQQANSILLLMLSPSPRDAIESLSTLRFGDRVRGRPTALWKRRRNFIMFLYGCGFLRLNRCSSSSEGEGAEGVDRAMVGCGGPIVMEAVAWRGSLRIAICVNSYRFFCETMTVLHCIVESRDLLQCITLLCALCGRLV